MNNFAPVMSAELRKDHETINLGKLLALADQIQTLCLASKTGEIRVTNVVPYGRINIVDGRVVHAQFGNRIGLEAAIALINLRNPESEILLGRGTPERTIHLNFVHILLEAACRKDETSMAGSAAGSAETTAGRPLLQVALGSETITCPLTTGLSMIGRMPNNDIVIPSGSVSRRHAGIKVSVNGVTLRDFDSTNGTYVDGQRITEAPLIARARLRFGNIEALFTCPTE